MDSSHHRLRATAIVSQAGVDLTQSNEIERWTQTWVLKFQNLNLGWGCLNCGWDCVRNCLKEKNYQKKLEDEKLLKKINILMSFQKFVKFKSDWLKLKLRLPNLSLNYLSWI